MRTLDLRAARDASDPSKAAVSAPVPRDRPAHVTYHERTATVVVTAPTGQQRTHIDHMAAVLAGGPWDHFSARAQARFHAMATFAVAVQDAPPWMEDAVQEDDNLLFSIVGAVEAHATAYFRRDAGSGEGGEGVAGVVVALADT
jgi:hypothetical protein